MIFRPDTETVPIITRSSAAREVLGEEKVVFLLAEAMREYKKLLESDAKDEEQFSGRAISISRMLSQLGILDEFLDELPYKTHDLGRVLGDGRFLGKVVFGGDIPRTGEPINQLVVVVSRADQRAIDEAQAQGTYRGRPAEEVAFPHEFKLSVTCHSAHLDDDGYRFSNSVGVEIKLHGDGGIGTVRGLSFLGATPHYSDPIKVNSEIGSKQWPAVRDNLLQMSAV